jgi:hypothetical protein
MVSRAIGAVLFVSLLGATSALALDDPPPPATEDRNAGPRTYGTANRTVLTISAWDFVPRLSTAITAVDGMGTSRCMDAASPDFNLRAGLRLPNGALLERISIEGCDETNTDQLSMAVTQCAVPSDFCLTAAVTSGDAFDGGCDVFGVNLTSPIEIDNTSYTYYFDIQMPPGCNLGTFRAARAAYRLQVSAAPQVATFSDVPLGHPQRQFIEALAAAGITSGCATGPLRYCPDDPLTRGQMAIFLSRALGLHWPF